jgi:cohesin complex subunit SA-1/2
MVEHALYFMMAHVIWRSRGLTRTEEPSPEEVQYREKLEEQRSILLNKVTEFAIGTQSNTLENVKRAASHFSYPLSNDSDVIYCRLSRCS